MYKTYLIGTGYLSSKISKKIKNSKIYSSRKFIAEVKNINKTNQKFNLIINAFYSARKLNNLRKYKFFVEKSLLNLSEILDKTNPQLINKILYTSSSSVYGSLGGKIGAKDKNNRYIYSSLKISAENLVKNYCNKNKVLFDICRVFNLYGLNDGFSIVSKLKELSEKNLKIKIYNNGESTRDFIHVDDVVLIYKKLLKKKNSNIYDVGTGKGIQIRNIINNLNLPSSKVNFIKKRNFEIDNSIANNTDLVNEIKFKKFKKLESFLKIKKLPFALKKIETNYLENTLIGSVIYGAGYSGKELFRQIRKYDKNIISYFVDDDPKKRGKYVDEIKILSYEDLKKLSTDTQIRNIIVAIPSLNKSKRNIIFKKILPLSSSISSLPEKKFYKSNRINIGDVSEISLEEILNKQIMETSENNLNNFRDKSILITGGAGSIGTELTKQLLKSNLKRLIVLDHSEFNVYRLNQELHSKKLTIILGNIQDSELIEKIIDKYKINYIFHTAAYKHVKFLENNIYSAIKNNIIGTFELLNKIKNKKIHFIFISTDKAVEPKNVLGITKRIGEILVNKASNDLNFKNSKFTIVRFGNVIGSDGSALPYFFNQIKKDLPISVSDKKMQRYFMTIKEACELVIKSTLINSKNKILFLDMGKQIKIIDIIKKIFEIYKVPNQKLKIKYTGNKYNEKLSEKLSIKNKFNKTKFNKIYSISDFVKNRGKLDLLLETLNGDISKYDNSKLYSFIKKFIK